MKNDIILAGVGGQGILTIAAIIGKAAMKLGLNVKQSEVHGMSQRGGAVLAHLRLSSDGIYSDLIADGTADVIIAVEPMEALRHIKGLSPKGVIIANSKPVKNIGDYPETQDVVDAVKAVPNSVVMDASFGGDVQEFLFDEAAVVEAEEEIGLHGPDPAHPDGVIDVFGGVNGDPLRGGQLGHGVEPDIFVGVVPVSEYRADFESRIQQCPDPGTAHVVISEDDALHRKISCCLTVKNRFTPPNIHCLSLFFHLCAKKCGKIISLFCVRGRR